MWRNSGRPLRQAGALQEQISMVDLYHKNHAELEAMNRAELEFVHTWIDISNVLRVKGKKE